MKICRKKYKEPPSKKTYQNNSYIFKHKNKVNTFLNNMVVIDNFLVMFLLLFLSNRILRLCAFWKITVFYLPTLFFIYSLQFLLLKYKTYEIYTISELQYILTRVFSLFHLSLNIFLFFLNLIFLCILSYNLNYKEEIEIILIKTNKPYQISYFFAFLIVIFSMIEKVKIDLECVMIIYQIGSLTYIIISSYILFIIFDCGILFIIAIIIYILIAVFIFCKLIVLKNIFCDSVVKEAIISQTCKILYLIILLITRFLIEFSLIFISPMLYHPSFLLEKEFYIFCRNKARPNTFEYIGICMLRLFNY
ncbi:hypothetical protein TUBRATIS_17770 [Tubulinosema ratisbonensis]|uniref:Uncharacterized protein n=1 Tax=Tubulinosema ratisbonensis TaxID=291195 RepID=A0A437AL30_9MICR|nr:hypothetical protein TUBRATIS_17770 [Tubulinosema ratisbonensis]